MTRHTSVVTVILLAGLVWVGVGAKAATAEELIGGGEWISLSSDAIRGKWSAALTRSGTGIQGTLTLGGSNVFSGGAVSGSLDAASIVLGVMSDAGKQASFSGKVTGESVGGEWESQAAGDHGVWYGTLKAK